MPVEILPSDSPALLTASPCPLLSGGERGQRVRARAVLREEHLEQLLELQHRTLARMPQPAGERPPTLLGDRIHRPLATPDMLGRGPSESVCDEFLRLFVQLAGCPGPDPAERAVHLLGELLAAPLLECEQ